MINFMIKKDRTEYISGAENLNIRADELKRSVCGWVYSFAG